MSPRIREHSWSLVSTIGSNTMPPRDPNDDEDEEVNEPEDEDEEPPAIREPDARRGHMVAAEN
jgi:hypothetical protein